MIASDSIGYIVPTCIFNWYYTWVFHVLLCICWWFEYKHYISVSSHSGFWGSFVGELRTLIDQEGHKVLGLLAWKLDEAVAQFSVVLNWGWLQHWGFLFWFLFSSVICKETKAGGVCVNLTEHCFLGTVSFMSPIGLVFWEAPILGPVLLTEHKVYTTERRNQQEVEWVHESMKVPEN